MIHIVDYGAGNLRSLQNAFEFIGMATRVSDKPGDLASAEKILLPGVGAFAHAMGNLEQQGFVEPLQSSVRAGVPVLGICLGMQLLLTTSDEHGRVEGLDLIHGAVTKLDCAEKIPHMGWNEIEVSSSSRLLKGLPQSGFAYFVHSYVCHPVDGGHVAARFDYVGEFCAAIERENIFGVQFHPEKSQEVGLQILMNFGEM